MEKLSAYETFWDPEDIVFKKAITEVQNEIAEYYREIYRNNKICYAIYAYITNAQQDGTWDKLNHEDSQFVTVLN